jgi:hypothetical protein
MGYSFCFVWAVFDLGPVLIHGVVKTPNRLRRNEPQGACGSRGLDAASGIGLSRLLAGACQGEWLQRDRCLALQAVATDGEWKIRLEILELVGSWCPAGFRGCPGRRLPLQARLRSQGKSSREQVMTQSAEMLSFSVDPERVFHSLP